MSINIDTKENFYWKKFEPSFPLSNFIEKRQEEPVSEQQIQVQDTIVQLNTNTVAQEGIITDSLSLQNSYPYILLMEDSMAVISPAVDFSNWLIPFDFNGYFSIPAHSKKTLSIKEAYPGKSGASIYRGIQTEIWFAPLLFLVFFSYGLTFFRKKKRVLGDLKEFFTFSFRNGAVGEEASADNFQSRILPIIAGIINISLFSFFVITRFSNHETEKFTLVLSLLLIITILYILFKIAMIKLICYIFFNKRLFSVWTNTFYSLILFSGIALIPVTLCLSFGPVTWVAPVIYAGFFFCICLSILYLSKITIFFFGDASSLFYLILYLCSLEILPTFIFLEELITAVINNGIII